MCHVVALLLTDNGTLRPRAGWNDHSCTRRDPTVRCLSLGLPGRQATGGLQICDTKVIRRCYRDWLTSGAHLVGPLLAWHAVIEMMEGAQATVFRRSAAVANKALQSS